MLRYRLATATLLALGMLCAAALPADEAKSKKATVNDAVLIQGVWTVVELHQVVHKPTEEEKEFLKTGKFKVTITVDKLIFSPDKSAANYQLDPSRNPKVLKLYDPKSKSRKPIALAIYDLKGDDLRICIGREPDQGDPEPPAGFDIKKAKPGTFPTLFVLKRDRAKEGAKKRASAKTNGAAREGRSRQ
jgi:uncharacterized protein (TIGR03067 family)